MTVGPAAPGPGDRDGTDPRAATRTAVRVLGLLAAAVAVEHGVGEVLQGPGAPESVVIESWPDSAAFATLAGEPALTLLPDLVLAGVVTLVVAAAVAAHVLTLACRRHDGVVLLGLALVLLLVGGGFGPPLLLAGLAVAWMLPTGPPRGAARLGRRLAARWRPLLLVTVTAYLGLVPGIPLLRGVAGVESAGLVALLGGTAFAGLALTLVGARAHDRLRTLVPVEAAAGPAD